MIIIKTEEQINNLREGGRRHAEILQHVKEKVVPGVSTKELDDYAHQLVIANGDTPAFLGYKPYGAAKPYPATLIVSVNDEVVHGIPSADRIIADGDVVSLDLGIWHNNTITDAAITVIAGTADPKDVDMIATAERALYAGIEQIKPGKHIGDISAAIEKAIGNKYGNLREYSGHGVGIEIHEEPYVPNYGVAGTGPVLKAGMVIAIEPMITRGGDEVYVDRDGYTVKTNDGSRAAHVEHTVAVTNDGYEILTTV